MTVQPIDPTIDYFSLPANEAARLMISRNEWTDDQWSQLMVCEEHDRERHFASRFGGCSVGCSDSNLIEHNGETICKWTRHACTAGRLNLILALYGGINRGANATNRNPHVKSKTEAAATVGGTAGANS